MLFINPVFKWFVLLIRIIAVALLAIILATLLYPIVYYLWDPYNLRRFPAPSIAGITSLWAARLTYTRNRSQVVHEAHQQLGKIIRIQPTHVSFNLKEAVQPIYGHSAPVLKADFYETFSPVDDPSRSIVTAIDREEHARKRRYFAAAFAHKSVVEMEHIVSRKLRALAQQFDRVADGKVPSGFGSSRNDSFINLYRWVNLFTFDVIGTMAFDCDMGFLEAGDDLTWAETEDGKRRYQTRPIAAFHAVSGYDVFWGHFPSLLRLTKHLTSWSPGPKKGAEFNDMVIYHMRRRMQTGRPEEGHRDFFDHVLSNRNGEAINLNFDEMLKEANVLFAAGSDTSATAMTNVLYLLIKNPRVLAKLREEIDPILDAHSEEDGSPVPRFAQVQGLKYLRACLDEAMRDRPPVGMGLPRVVREGGVTIAGQFVKAGVTVSVPTWTLHHDPELFPEPFEYRPERWLGDSGSSSDDGQEHGETGEKETCERQVKENLKYAIPFSLGSRACIGRNLAYFEQYLLIAMVVHRYDFHMEREDFVLGSVERLNTNPGDFWVRVSRRRR
jgi:cytochrome P450